MTDLDVSEPRDFICYLHEGWNPRTRPAEATRPWMGRAIATERKPTGVC